MSIRDQLRTDVKTNLTADGDTVVLTPPGEEPTIYTVKGMVGRIDAGVDPDTDVQFLEPKTTVTVSLADLDGNEPDETWLIETTDAEGNALKSMGIDLLFDRTLGFVKIMMEDFD